MTQSTLDAIRRLAERPGTEHEGIVAREMLAKLQGKIDPDFRDYEAEYEAAYSAFARKEIPMDAFLDAMRRRNQDYVNRIPTTWTCACGSTYSIGDKCHNASGHLRVGEEIRGKFKRGDVVFYNMWAYPQNCSGIVAAHVPMDKNQRGTYPWGWISVRFGHLKSARQVPIVSDRGWHLTKEPVSDEVYRRMALTKEEW